MPFSGKLSVITLIALTLVIKYSEGNNNYHGFRIPQASERMFGFGKGKGEGVEEAGAGGLGGLGGLPIGSYPLWKFHKFGGISLRPVPIGLDIGTGIPSPPPQYMNSMPQPYEAMPPQTPPSLPPPPPPPPPPPSPPPQTPPASLEAIYLPPPPPPPPYYAPPVPYTPQIPPPTPSYGWGWGAPSGGIGWTPPSGWAAPAPYVPTFGWSAPPSGWAAPAPYAPGAGWGSSIPPSYGPSVGTGWGWASGQPGGGVGLPVAPRCKTVCSDDYAGAGSSVYNAYDNNGGILSAASSTSYGVVPPQQNYNNGWNAPARQNQYQQKYEPAAQQSQQISSTYGTQYSGAGGAQPIAGGSSGAPGYPPMSPPGEQFPQPPSYEQAPPHQTPFAGSPSDSSDESSSQQQQQLQTYSPHSLSTSYEDSPPQSQSPPSQSSDSNNGGYQGYKKRRSSTVSKTDKSQDLQGRSDTFHTVSVSVGMAPKILGGTIDKNTNKKSISGEDASDDLNVIGA